MNEGNEICHTTHPEILYSVGVLSLLQPEDAWCISQTTLFALQLHLYDDGKLWGNNSSEAGKARNHKTICLPYKEVCSQPCSQGNGGRQTLVTKLDLFMGLIPWYYLVVSCSKQTVRFLSVHPMPIADVLQCVFIFPNKTVNLVQFTFIQCSFQMRLYYVHPFMPVHLLTFKHNSIRNSLIWNYRK